MNNDSLYSDLNKIKEKLAQCRLEEHKSDHDKVIKIESNVSTLTVELQKITDNQTIMADKLYEITGNLNLISDKVVQIVSKDNRKTGLWYTIIGGIIVTLLGSLIIYMVNSTVKNIQEKDNIDSRIEFIINKKVNNDSEYGKHK